MPDLVPGFQVTPSIRLSRKLGEGGMGSIWIADHLKLETEVAVKFVSTDLAQNEDVLERFSREASASAKIRSPHVVQVFDHGEADGIPFIVMELLVGEDLNERLERDGPMTVQDFIPILRQVGKGLSMAHDAGVIHRDIKPANIFLTKPDGELFVKLLDFGIAKSGTQPSPSVTQPGAIVGTPYYMSPEQIFTPDEVDSRSDLWALAVVVYEVLSGTLPFDGETLGAVNVAIASGKYEPLTRRCPGMPASGDEWFHRAFHKDRNKRFASAKEFVDAFVLAFPVDARAISKTNSKDYFPLASNPPPALSLQGDPRAAAPFLGQANTAFAPSPRWNQQPPFPNTRAPFDPRTAQGLTPLHRAPIAQPRGRTIGTSSPQKGDSSKELVRAIIKAMVLFFCVAFLIGCVLIAIRVWLRTI